MSRSIHTTRKDLDRIDRHGWDVGAPTNPSADRRNDLERELQRKRAYKRGTVKRHERKPAENVSPAAVDDLCIRVVNRGPTIHYALSVRDIRGALASLPPGPLQGLRGLHLCLGKKEVEPTEDWGHRGVDRDPWHGRASEEIMPGVWSPWDMYDCDGTGRITLYAYVCRGYRFRPAIAGFLLKLESLGWLSRAVAEHDRMTRSRSAGRAPTSNAEHRASLDSRRRAAVWLRDCMIPYLIEANPIEARQFQSWLRNQTGVDWPLFLVAGHCFLTDEGELEPCQLGTCVRAVFALVNDLINGVPFPQRRLNIASELRYSDNYVQALKILDVVLRDCPDCLEAREMYAEYLNYLDRPGDAAALASAVLANNPDSLSAAEQLARARLREGKWRQLRAAATHGLAALRRQYDRPFALLNRWSFLEYRFRARLELGHFARAKADLETLAVEFEVMTASRFRASQILAYRSLLALRSNDLLTAFKLAGPAARPGGAHWDKPELVLKVVRFEAARRLKRQGEAGRLTPKMLNDLREFGFGGWAEQLEEEYL